LFFGAIPAKLFYTVLNGQAGKGSRGGFPKFCHLVLRQSGVSNVGGDRNDAPNPAVERFCNAVAAAALMPSSPFRWSRRLIVVMRSPPLWCRILSAALQNLLDPLGEVRAPAANLDVNFERSLLIEVSP